MALTRAMLKGMGITGEQIDVIIEAHAETVDGLKEERDGYKANSETLKTVRQELAQAKNELETLRNNGGDDWEGKYNQIKKEYDDYKTDINTKESKRAKETAYRNVLKDAGLSERGIAKAVKYADWDSIEMDGEEVKDVKALVKTAKEEWAEYIVKSSINGARTQTPPNGGGGEILSKADIYKKDENGRYVMSASERQKALADMLNDSRKE